MDNINVIQQKNEEERNMDEKIRKMMNTRRITYQEARKLLRKKQSSLFDFND